MYPGRSIKISQLGIEVCASGYELSDGKVMVLPPSVTALRFCLQRHPEKGGLSKLTLFGKP